MNVVVLVGLLAHVVVVSNGDDSEDFEDFLNLLEKLDNQTDIESCPEEEPITWTMSHDSEYQEEPTQSKFGIICFVCINCKNKDIGQDSPAVCEYCMNQRLDGNTVTRLCVEPDSPLCSSDSGSCCSTDYCNSQRRNKGSLNMTLFLTVLVSLFTM